LDEVEYGNTTLPCTIKFQLKAL